MCANERHPCSTQFSSTCLSNITACEFTSGQYQYQHYHCAFHLCHLHHYSQYHHHSLYTPQKRAEKLMSEKKFSLAKVDYQCAIDTKGKKKSFLVQKHMIWGRKRGIPLYNIVSIIQREPSPNSWLWVLLCWWSLLLCILKALMVLEISHASCFLYV